MSTTTKHPALSNGATYVTTIEEGNIKMGNNGVSVSSSTVGQSGKTPLQPKSVSAKFADGVITVTMTVYVDVDDDITSFGIYQESMVNLEEENLKKVKPIYIVYDCPEVSTKLLYEYSFSFEVSDSKGSVNYLDSYLYDKDPVTSRGTVTKVQKTTEVGGI